MVVLERKALIEPSGNYSSHGKYLESSKLGESLDDGKPYRIRVLCHQFSTSSLPRLGNCIKRFSPCWLRRNQLREALLLQ